MQDKLVIFDCYKTLVEAEEIADGAYKSALKELFDIEGKRTDADPTATTAQAVLIEVARKKGLDESTIASKESLLLPTYEAFFENYVRIGEVIILPGIMELLEALQRSEVPLGVYTGDSFRTLNALLKRSGLDKYFPEDMRSCGSNETPDRTELLRLAIEKAERKYNAQFSPYGTYVVDDSWRGVKAANILGIMSIGVGEKSYFEKAVVQTTYTVLDFSDYQRVLSLILG